MLHVHMIKANSASNLHEYSGREFLRCKQLEPSLGVVLGVGIGADQALTALRKRSLGVQKEEIVAFCCQQVSFNH
jgi:hypothetical protein